ncbi:NAD(P)-binding protein [Saccharata proteae CBS 121410]|uniref:NAD(P)-binding protein n=1 Tax=Saccharata proteae CBS 121410 TaxID=1314787 RepID=A0A9P4LTK7_9PEZI|nr:NAD(P)-binding protein [Saccharata proteae CBS 121410]
MAAPKPLNFLITGAGRGIGRGLTRLLLQRGHRVLLLDNNAEELQHFCEILRPNFHGKYAILKCDLRKPKNIFDAAFHANKMFKGHLDVLINNAAYTSGVGGASIADMSLDEWNASIETNLTGPMLMSQACLPMLRKHETREMGGTIINMSSTRAHQSEPASEGYATTKAGLIGLTHSMAVSLAPMGITVNAILPGWINVVNECKEADEKGMEWGDRLSKQDHEWHLSGRVGKVEDILQVVEYLVGARFVTGTEQIVDGGVTRKMVYPE